jgi:hypothetical protein
MQGTPTMPVNANWHNETHTIVRVQISDPWTLPELAAAIQESRQMQDSVSHQVDAIWDSSDAKTVPNNLLSHFMLSSQNTKVPRNQRAVVVVARSTLLKTFVHSAKRVMPQVTKNVHLTETIEAAEQKLSALRQPAN